MFTEKEYKLMNIKYPLEIFFDGSCGVCSTEMSYYRSIADQRIEFIDIADVDFDAEAFGRTAEEFQRQLHVRDADGRYFTGVEAFRKLWEALPSPFYPLLSSLVGLPGVHATARIGYAFFARFRHWMPVRHAKTCPITKR